MTEQEKTTSDSKETGEEDDLVIESVDLLQGRRMVVISHNGERYRLIETRNGKLILQK